MADRAEEGRKREEWRNGRYVGKECGGGTEGGRGGGWGGEGGEGRKEGAGGERIGLVGDHFPVIVSRMWTSLYEFSSP